MSPLIMGEESPSPYLFGFLLDPISADDGEFEALRPELLEFAAVEELQNSVLWGDDPVSEWSSDPSGRRGHRWPIWVLVGTVLLICVVTASNALMQQQNQRDFLSLRSLLVPEALRSRFRETAGTIPQQQSPLDSGKASPPTPPYPEAGQQKGAPEKPP